MDQLLNISKIEPSGFSSTKVLAEVTKDTEEMYAVHFGKHRVHLLVPSLTRGLAYSQR